MQIRIFACLMMVGAALSLAGCSSPPPEPDHTPKLGVAQNADGNLTFALTTEVGYEYAIYYMDPKSNGWKVIPGLDSIRGTGAQVEVKKRFNSSGSLPAFTVRHTKMF